MSWVLLALVLALAVCVLSAPSVRCRLGLHRWRRRPVLVATPTPGLSGLRWHVVCDRCDLDRDSLKGVAE